MYKVTLKYFLILKTLDLNNIQWLTAKWLLWQIIIKISFPVETGIVVSLWALRRASSVDEERSLWPPVGAMSLAR